MNWFVHLLNAVASETASPLTLGYLDDLTLDGEESTVAADVELIERESESLGLRLNHSKCEVISRIDTKFNNLKNFKPVKPDAATWGPAF